MENNRYSGQDFRSNKQREIPNLKPGAELPNGIDLIAPYAKETAIMRAFELGVVPEKGHGRYSLPNAERRAKVLAKEGDIFTDPVTEKNKRRQQNAAIFQPFGRKRR